MPENDQFWDVDDELIAAGRVEEGSMMGRHCLRVRPGGGFVATVEQSSGNLVVKLPQARVGDLVASGRDLAFAPTGRTFREWVQIPEYDAAEWASLIDESVDFVSAAV